jgi:hypothetical protein
MFPQLKTLNKESRADNTEYTSYISRSMDHRGETL